MKKYLILTMYISGWFLSGCEKDLLETIPNDRLSTQLFWKTENDGILAVNAAYTYLDGTNIFFWDGITDIGHSNYSFNPEAYIEKGTTDALNSKFFNEYNNAYDGIARCNNVLDNVDKIPTSNTTLINRLKGEARVLRAYQYIKLVSLFGDVPLVTKTISIEEGRNLTRMPSSEIWDFINQELSDCASLLPTTYPSSDNGRVTKGAALALKARANLYAGRFQQAADDAKAVMDLNVYSLYPDYARLFTYAAENNNEFILTKQRIADVASSDVFQLMGPFSQKGSKNNYVPAKKLTDMFDMNDGKPISDPASGFDPYHPYANRDPRLHYTTFLPGDTLPDGKIFNSTPNSSGTDAVGRTMNATSTGFVLKKYINKEDYANPGNCGINFCLLRYAEVLLTYAEAKIELGQIDQSVFDAINLVRSRSDVHMPAISNGLTQGEMRTVVRKERTLELAFEGLHLFDIRRWKTAENVMPGDVEGLTYVDNGQLQTVEILAFEKVFNPNRDYLWAIPQRERELNPNLTQNPGW